MFHKIISEKVNERFYKNVSINRCFPDTHMKFFNIFIFNIFYNQSYFVK